MIPRIAAASILAISTALAFSLPASAAPPERMEKHVFDADVEVVDEFLTEACGFTVTARVSGHYFETVFFDRDGAVTRVTAHPSFRSTLTSPTATLTTADVGLDRFVENEDGTLSIFGTGIHLKIAGDTNAIGLWRLEIDLRTGELISEEYHGRFDVGVEGTVDAICEALS